MRLFLSSYRTGDHEDELLSLVPGGRVAVSANANDDQPPIVRDKLASIERALFTELGYDAHDLDLRRGYSAGAVVAGATLHGVEHVDATDDLPADYPSREIVWDGMQLVPYAIVPHWGAAYDEAARLPEMVAELEARGVPYRTLRDDQVIVVRT